MKTGRFELFEDTTEEFGKELIVLGPDNNNGLYAYSYYGLFRISLTNRTVSLLHKAEIETGSINTAEIHNGVIQFGTNYGLFSYDTRSGVEKKVHSELFNRVSKLHYGTGGNLWVAADNSLFLYRNGVFEMLGENRGVPANEFMASVTDNSGSIFFGGTNGLIEIGDTYSYDMEKDKAFTSSLLKFIDDNLANTDLNVADIAMNMAMSRASLYNKVNNSFNKGVASLIEERRMLKAEELLRTTSLSVLEISEKCGYATSRYFSTRFKQLHDDLTPLKYRRLNGTQA